MNSISLRNFIALLVLVSTGIYAANKGKDGILITLQADDLKVVQAGETVYQAHCASCHGQYLEGQPDWRKRDANGYLPAPPHDASGHTWHHADDLLFEITKFGPAAVIGDANYKTLMPAYEKLLSDQEIVAVLSFIKNTWPAQEREWQEQMNGNDPNEMGMVKEKSSLLEKLLK